MTAILSRPHCDNLWMHPSLKVQQDAAESSKIILTCIIRWTKHNVNLCKKMTDFLLQSFLPFSTCSTQPHIVVAVMHMIPELSNLQIWHRCYDFHNHFINRISCVWANVPQFSRKPFPFHSYRFPDASRLGSSDFLIGIRLWNRQISLVRMGKLLAENKPCDQRDFRNLL